MGGGDGGAYGQPGGAGVPGGMPGPGGLNPSTGQPDYSAQWADYYRSVGMLREAEAIEQQMRGRGPGQAPAAAMAAPAPAAPQAAPAANGAAQNGGGADYSAQWAEYYRSIGKVKEAETIEAQMKQKVFFQPYGI